jgi:3',5'-cyclic AMP phosphodiesterase CpdA
MSCRWSIALLLPTLACKPPVQLTPPSAAASAAEVALSGASVLIGAGDIAVCGVPGADATARLVDSVLRADAAAKVPDEVFTAGDNAYPDGSARDFALCWGPTWGDTAKLIMKKIHPSPGNHEHLSGEAAPYYQYFGSRAGSSKAGYYSYDIGAWHAVALNSEMVINVDEFTEADRRAQEAWLKQDLASHNQRCTVAYWHHPRFSSGWHGSDPALGRIWQILFDGGVDLVLNGHDHEYERFLPQSPAGVRDTLTGITEIVVGTGGGDLRGFPRAMLPNSAANVQGRFGVIKLTLGGAEWRSAFLDTSGRVYDAVGGRCH